jgi:hypothetical protein
MVLCRADDNAALRHWIYAPSGEGEHQDLWVAETDGGSTPVIWLGEALVTPKILMLSTPAERESERSADFVTPPSTGSESD